MKELFDSENLPQKNDKCLYIYINRQTDRQTDRQAGRQADRERQIDVDRYRIDTQIISFFFKKKLNTEQLKNTK